MAKAKKSKCCRRSDGYCEIESEEYIGPDSEGKYDYRVTVRCPYCGKALSEIVQRYGKVTLRVYPEDNLEIEQGDRDGR